MLVTAHYPERHEPTVVSDRCPIQRFPGTLLYCGVRGREQGRGAVIRVSQWLSCQGSW